jgi:quercetin dioxygenase-like cupin family protein
MVRNGASWQVNRYIQKSKEIGMIKTSITAVALGLLLMNGSAARADGTDAKVTIVYEHELPNVPGKSIKGVLVEYGPGGSSPGHTHPNSAFIYATVLEGAIRSQVNDGPVKVYRAGENFSEMPGDRHGVSANDSKTEPARLLAVFVVDTNEKTPLTTPIK